MSQGLLDVERIRQYPGQIQAARRVCAESRCRWQANTFRSSRRKNRNSSSRAPRRAAQVRSAPEGLGSAHTS
eukprot:5201775-Prymnesium_polylepis.1